MAEYTEEEIRELARKLLEEVDHTKVDQHTFRGRTI